MTGAPRMPRNPLWSVIATTLAQEIAAGRYAAGDRLPSEAQLAARFGVNRHTLRRAIAHLTEAGLVQPRMGAGVFVVPGWRIDYPLGRRVRFHAAIAAQGGSAQRTILSAVTRRADAREAGRLDLAEGAEVHVAEGVSHADGVPIALFRTMWPAARLPRMLDLLRADASFTAALAAHGVTDYVRRRTDITATRADATQALRLRLAEGAALLVTEADSTDPEGTAIEFSTSWFAADRVTLTVAPD